MPVSNLPGRSLIGISGPDAQHFLHNLVTSDIEGLAAGELTAGALLTPQGKILFDFLVSRDGTGFLLDCNTAIAADFAKRLKFYRLRAKVEIDVQDQALAVTSFDLDSDHSADLPATELWLGDRRFSGTFQVRRRYGGTAPNGGNSYDLLRVQNGVAEGVSDYALGEAFAHDVNLDQIGGVSFAKGCYVGQEVVSRMQHRGTARRRVLIATGAAPLSPRAELTAGGRSIGTLGTAAGDKALALVRIDKAGDAIKAGLEILAAGVPVSLALPPRVSFGWPSTGKEGE